jgi:hypothetical protein
MDIRTDEIMLKQVPGKSNELAGKDLQKME